MVSIWLIFVDGGRRLQPQPEGAPRHRRGQHAHGAIADRGPWGRANSSRMRPTPRARQWPCASRGEMSGSAEVYCRYCWMRVVRKPARPWRSIEYCQARNSSTVRVYRLQASSSDNRPPRTAATTSALRRITQRFVPGAGRSAIVSGLPSGPITYFALGRWGSVMGTLTRRQTTNQAEITWRNLRFG